MSSKQLTNEEFLQRMAVINPDVEILGMYVKRKEKIKCRCKICGNIWSPFAENLLSGHGCRKCYDKKRIQSTTMTNEDFMLRLSIINESVIPLETYSGIKNHIQVQCNKCGHIWDVTPDHLLRDRGCPICSKKEGGRKRIVDWDKIVSAFDLSPYILLSSSDEYTNNHESCLRCYCLEHGEFNISWGNFSKFEGCPVCQGSKGENKIFKYLTENKIDFIRQYYFDDLVGVNNGYLKYDFYIPSNKCLIEYQGEFHDGTAYQQTFEEFKIQQEHDKRKKEYAKNHNIDLLEIWYWDFDNIESILNEKLNNTIQND